MYIIFQAARKNEIESINQIKIKNYKQKKTIIITIIVIIIYYKK
jgi:hypothetical protein